MFQKTKLNKSYLSAIGMALVLLFINTLGIFIQTRIGQITPPSSGSWSNYMTTPAGSGTEASPYKVTTPNQLAWFLSNGSNAYVTLDNDIDMAEHSWSGIPSGKVKNFDGKSHTISNLNGSQGLFVEVSGKTCNLTLANVDIVGSGNVGSLAGMVASSEIIENINVTSGKIVGSGNCNIGGLIGMSVTTNLKNSINNADVVSTSLTEGLAGGIVGSGSSNISGCINTGDVTGYVAAGIAGQYQNVENCLAECTINAVYNAAGVSFGNAGGGASGYAKNSGFNGAIAAINDSISAVYTIAPNAQNSFGVADVFFKSTDISAVKSFGGNNVTNSYNFANVYDLNASKKEIRKFKYSTEDSAFTDFAYHKNINGGFPFPRSLFAVGQFIDSDVYDYLKVNGFSKINYKIQYDGTHHYVELGQYPQTWVGSSMNTTLENWYSGRPVVDTYTIDNGTSSTSNVYNAYKYTNGNTYVRVSGIARDSDSHFADGTKITTGTIYWFKVEPIKWWVLNYTDVQNGAAPIVLAEKGLTANVTWNKSSSDQNLWASKSNIRTWLNSTFYNDALSEVKDDIQTTQVKNNTQSDYTDGSGTTTSDNVWLLSYGEVYGESSTKYSEKQYFNSNTERLCIATDFCGAQNSIFQNSTNSACDWWLRSARISSTSYAQYVNFVGTLSLYDVYNTGYAVRPALTLNL